VGWCPDVDFWRFLGHRLGDDLVDWNSGVSVRPSVRPQSFSDFHLIWCVGRPRPHMRTSVTSTRSKVKVKVTKLPNLRKVHFSRSISSAISAWSSKLMVDGVAGLPMQCISRPVIPNFSFCIIRTEISTVLESRACS